MTFSEMQSFKRSTAIFIFVFAVEVFITLLGLIFILKYTAPNVDKLLAGEDFSPPQIPTAISAFFVACQLVAYFMGAASIWFLNMILMPPSYVLLKQVVSLISILAVAMGAVVSSAAFSIWVLRISGDTGHILAGFMVAGGYFFNATIQITGYMLNFTGWYYRSLPAPIAGWGIGILGIASLFNFVIYQPPTPSFPIITASAFQVIAAVSLAAYLYLDSLRQPVSTPEHAAVIDQEM